MDSSSSDSDDGMMADNRYRTGSDFDQADGGAYNRQDKMWDGGNGSKTNKLDKLAKIESSDRYNASKDLVVVQAQLKDKDEKLATRRRHFF